jgi:pimeloyl-ACP methyl ester carboxylesterase
MNKATQLAIDAHMARGHAFEAAGVRSFVRDEGNGEAIVLFHGLPASSFLYRKIIPRLAAAGFRGLSFDLPGLGLADRPSGFDYSFAGLGRFAAAAVDALGLDRFHLVVHDAGGPVGFEMAATMPERIRSLTVLNTIVTFEDQVPFVMEVYAKYATGPLWPALPPRRLARELIYAIGILNHAAAPPEEVDAYRELALGDDNGRAYLQIMRHVEDARQHGRSYESVVDTRTVPYPVQLIWSTDDPVLPLHKQGERARKLARVESIHTLPGKHYFQEDQAPGIASAIAAFAAEA